MDFKGLPWLRWRRDFFPTSLIVGILVAFALLAVRVVSIDSPVMGSDEYAYFQTAHFDEARDTLFRLDPNLQRVDNKVYPWLYKLWSLASEQRVADVGRLFNALIFSLCALLLFAIFQRLFERRTALIASLLYLMFPFSIYATMLLPEVEFQCFVYVLVVIWVYGVAAPSWQRIALAAGVSAVGYLIKPHAVAAIAASIVWLGVVGWLFSGGAAPLRRLWSACWRPVLYACATYLFIKLLGRLLDPNTSGAVVSSFYAAYLTKLTSVHYLITHLASTGVYVLGHLWVICLFFAPAAPLVVSLAWNCLHSAGGRSGAKLRAPQADAMAMFIVLLAITTIAMVALFTDAAASVNDFEQGRLHGRYIAALLPLLLGYAVAGVDRFRAGAVAVFALVSLWSFALLGNRVFKLYPWDYPDLFGLFRATPGHWSFDGAFVWPFMTTVAVGTACWLAFAFGRHRRLIYATFLVATMLLAHVQTGAWLAFQSRNSQASIDAGNAIASYLGEQSAGKGMIVTADRYGQASYLLAAIDSLQYVRWTMPPAKVRSGDIPSGVQWVVAETGADVELPAAAQLRFGPYRLFLLEGEVAWSATPTPRVWGGEPFSVPFAQVDGLSKFHGFNAAEPWGRWSNSEEAFVDLPARLKGPIVVKFFAWSSNPTGDVVSFEMGGSEARVRLTGEGADYSINLAPSLETERLYIRTNHVDASGPRRLGVAIARIHISRP